jgi:hypothetical protein
MQIILVAVVAVVSLFVAFFLLCVSLGRFSFRLLFAQYRFVSCRWSPSCLTLQAFLWIQLDRRLKGESHGLETTLMRLNDGSPDGGT